MQDFVQNCGRCIKNWSFKHKNLVGFRGLRPPDPPPGALPPGPPLGALPPDPRYRLALPRSPWPWLIPHFYVPSAVPGDTANVTIYY